MPTARASFENIECRIPLLVSFPFFRFGVLFKPDILIVSVRPRQDSMYTWPNAYVYRHTKSSRLKWHMVLSPCWADMCRSPSIPISCLCLLVNHRMSSYIPNLQWMGLPWSSTYTCARLLIPSRKELCTTSLSFSIVLCSSL